MSIPYDRVYKVRGLLMAPPCLFELFVFYRESAHDAVVWPAGLALFLLGVGLRVWAQVHLHYRLRTRKVLTTTGPYAFVRNPIYIANTLILLSMTVLSELIWFLPVKLLWCAVVYHFVVRREEAHLLDKYGADYQAFLDRVPRWIPRFRGRVASPFNARQFFMPSVLAELHCFLLLAPVVIKELLDRAFL